jgi:hypothetical protein
MPSRNKRKARQAARVLAERPVAAVKQVDLPCVKPTHTTRYLVWNGVYTDAGTQNRGYLPVVVGEEPPYDPSINLVRVDPLFAPIHENAVMEVAFTNLERVTELRLDIYDFDGGLVYRETISGADAQRLPTSKDDAEHHLAPGADIDRGLASESAGPYRIEVWFSTAGKAYAAAQRTMPDLLTTLQSRDVRSSTTRTSVKPSIELQLVPWDVVYQVASGRGDASDPGEGATSQGETMWLQYKLNSLGYWAGPIDGAPNNDAFKRAVRRFRLAHPRLSGWSTGPFYRPSSTDPKTYEMVLDDSKGQISQTADAALVTEIGSPAPEGVARKAFSDAAGLVDPTRGTRLMVDNQRAFLGDKSEFERAGSGAPLSVKYRIERDWLSEPHVPLAAVVTFESKDGRKLPAPAGIPLVWSWTDEAKPDEAAALERAGLVPKLPKNTPAEPSTIETYIQRTIADLAPDPAYKNNVASSAGGALTKDHAANLAGAFVHCPPFAALERTAAGVVVPTTTGHGHGLDGASVVYLKTTTIAGDRYRVHVGLDGGDPSLCKSGPIVVWRRFRMAAYVTWPARTGFDLTAELGKVAAEYEACHIEVDRGAVVTLAAHDILTAADYGSIIDRGEIAAERKAHYKHVGIQATAILPGNPDFHPSPEKIGALANALLRSDNLGRAVGAGTVGQLAPRDVAFALWLAKEWEKSSNGKVHAAGAHWKGQLEAVVDGTGTLTGNGPLMPHHDGSDVDLEVLEELLLPAAVKAEIDTYARDTSGAARPARLPELLGWVRKAQSTKAPKTPYNAVQAKLKGLPWPINDPQYGPYAEFDYFAALAVLKEKSLFSSYFDNLQDRIKEVLPGAGWNFGSSVDRTGPLLSRKNLVNRPAYNMMMGAKNHIAERVDERARARLASANKATDGYLVLDFSTNEETTFGGARYRIPGAAFGGLDGVAMIDQGQISGYYSLLCHELSHCMVIKHGKNAPSTVTEDHDLDDDNCVMSYPLPTKKADFVADVARSQIEKSHGGALVSPKDHYCIDAFKPHFCGKCNLKLRGWNIRAPGTPARASDPPPPAPPVKPVAVRLIAGTVADADDAPGALTRIPFTCYPIDRCGPDLRSLKDFPTGFTYDADAAADPGVFRVEVDDPNLASGKDTITVTIEALMPSYAGGRATDWGPFGPDIRKSRALFGVECKLVGPGRTVYRSRYLRLCTDEADFEALKATKQGLLVTDIADGKDGPEDAVEILDQQVQVTYDPTPPGPPPDDFPTLSSNRIVTTADVGRDAGQRKRIKVFLHFVGFDKSRQPLVLVEARRRFRKWARRVFASADMSPKILGHDCVAWPAKSTLSIHSRYLAVGSVATKTNLATGLTRPPAKQSNFTLTLNDGTADFTWTIPMLAGMTPRTLGAAIRDALDRSFSAVCHSVPAATDEWGHEPSCDVVFRHPGGTATVVTATMDDAAMQAAALEIPDPAAKLNNDDTYHGGSATQRVVLRSVPTTDDRIDVFVVPTWKLPGRAYPDYTDDLNAGEVAKYVVAAHPTATQIESAVPVTADNVARHLPDQPLRRAVIIAYKGSGSGVMDGGDEAPFTLPHELGHVLGDVAHLKVSTAAHANPPAAAIDVMYGDWPKTNSKTAAKRILSAPLLVSNPHLVSNVLPTDRQQDHTDVDMRTFMHTRGGSRVTEAW